MKVDEVLESLQKYGDERTKNTLMRHGAQEPFFGVKVGDLKKILKKTGKDHELSLELYKTGNSDAMYLAGLMADETKITKKQLNDWVNQAYWSYLSEYAVPWVAAETPYGFELGMQWIESENEQIASAGWSTLSNFASVKSDSELNIEAYSLLIDRVLSHIGDAQNRVRYTMNGFIIAVGVYIQALTEKAQKAAAELGTVEVYMGDTACKVPEAKLYIQKVIDKKRIGVKRKMARC